MADQAAINAMNAAIAAIQALQAAVIGLPAAIQAAVQQPLPGIGPFMRTPLRANVAIVLDYNNKEYRRAYYSHAELLFRPHLVEPVEYRDAWHRIYGAIGQIAKVPQDPILPHIEQFIMVIEEYARLNLDQVRTWENTLISNNDRMSQDSTILFDSLMHTFSVTGLQRIQIWKDQHMINGNDAKHCHLKVIIRESYLDSNATVSTIRMNLTTLDDYIRKKGF